MQAIEAVARAACHSADRRIAHVRCQRAQADYEQSARLRFANVGEKLGIWCAAHDEALRQGNFGLPVPPPYRAPRPAPPRAAAAAPVRAAARSRFEPVAFTDGWTPQDRMRGEPLAIYHLRMQRAR